MRLTETLLKPFLKKRNATDVNKVSSVVHPNNVLKNLDGEELNSAWFSGDTNLSNFLNANIFDKNTIVAEQALKIDLYRRLAFHNSEVKNCVEEIVNEVVGDYQEEDPLFIEYKGDDKSIEKAITDAFNEICSILHIKSTLHDIVEHAYIDGQIILHLTYTGNSPRKGIKSIDIIEPKFLYFDPKENIYRYIQDSGESGLYCTATPIDKRLQFSPEEIARVDFGLYEKNICLSYLEFGIKNANILQNLEDLLVPLRFSRSISRRVFNVDVGNLPPKRVDEVMKQVQNKFKYKKFYNQETGEISNQQHITAMVEDYWFPNRAGGKGTSVEVLDESGNLGELSDITYYVKKLYRSLNVPASRSNLEDIDKVFDYEATSTSKEDIKFFGFITRLRHIYSKLFMEVLKRHVVAKNIMTEKEFGVIEGDLNISFTARNKFIEKMEQSNLRDRMDIFAQIEPQIGKLFSVDFIFKKVIGMTDEDIDAMMKQIEAEEKDKRYAKFYQAKDEDDTDF